MVNRTALAEAVVSVEPISNTNCARDGELGTRAVPVGPGGERPVAEVGARQVVGGRDRLPGGDGVGGGEIVLGIGGHGVVVVRGAIHDGGATEARERRARGDPEIAVEHRRTGIRHRGSAKDHEGLDGGEVDRGCLRGGGGGKDS